MYEDVVVAVKLVDIVLPSDMLELDEIMAEGTLFPVLMNFKVLETRKGASVIQNNSSILLIFVIETHYRLISQGYVIYTISKTEAAN
jgi:hypothetical protein